MDYKETLNLPQTTFPMRGNLPQNEPKVYEEWKKQDIYQHAIANRKGKGREFFTLHDGPPYANGHIHIGHALNKILKDIVVKFHYFSGKEVRYTPGWDCHGLPIEQQVEKKLGKEKKAQLSKVKIRELCRKHAKEFVDIQSKEFQELGVIGDFKHPYKTMDYSFEADIYRCLCEIAKKGLLCERNKPIYWSWAAQSALAEAEVEYEEKESDSIYVAFPLQQDAIKALGAEQFGLGEICVVIWTTTPWTLPSNVAIAFNKEAKYALTSDGKIVLANQVSNLSSLGVCSNEILKTFSASVLEKTHAINPLNGRSSLLILGDHVATEEGSGCVHTATGHGEDDYFVGLKYGLPVIMPVNDNGCFDVTIVKEGLFPKDVVQELVGQFVFDTHKKIFELLGKYLLSHKTIRHSYPHCWRTHQPIIFRATKQWFIAMDLPFDCNGVQKTLREVALSELDKTQFFPEHGKNRIVSMIANRPDWCISRQRDWGVPIAFLQNKEDGSILLDSEVLEHIANLFEKEGCDIWWSYDISQLLPPSYKNLADKYKKIEHILDVWFDSGSTWRAVLQSGHYDAGKFPASIYLEGSDQHRGWFQSSLLVSCAINGRAPYLSILTHGFTMDENGEKMSKSKGNVIAPKDVLKEFGSEILRLWVALSDYQNDLRISNNILKQTTENYRKIRNTIRFLLANCEDMGEDITRDNWGAFIEKYASEIDLWILSIARETFLKTFRDFENYNFAKGLQGLNHFLINDLSGIYLDICKDNLYCNAPHSHTRRASQAVMAWIAYNLLVTLAPILTYTIEEAISHSKCGLLNKKSVFDFDGLWDVVGDITIKTPSLDFELLLAIRDRFLENIERLKQDGVIKTTLELDLATQEPLDTKQQEAIETLLMVSTLRSGIKEENFLGSFEVGGIKFSLLKAVEYKCPRCWRYKAEKEEELCNRCREVV